MLRLTLVRHAKAESQQPGQEDWDRALDLMGQAEAADMGRRLARRNLQPTTLSTSTALRALTTAQVLARELSLPNDSIVPEASLYLISAPDLLRWIQQQPAQQQPTRHLMIVAHNPGLSEFAARITVDSSVDSLPTCAIYTLQFPIAQWRELSWASGENAQLDFPGRA